MPNKNEIEIYRKAIKHWGEELQIIMVIEEMSELIKALTKFVRKHESISSVGEEIADLEIMLEQIKILFSDKYPHLKFDRYIDDVKKGKLKKLKGMLDND